MADQLHVRAVDDGDLVDASGQSAHGFSVDTSRVAESGVVRFVGELDLQFAEAARQTSIAALREISTETDVLTLDLSGLTFCDASGIRVIVGLAHAAAARGHRAVLRHPGSIVRLVLSITRVDTWLEIEERPTAV